jgi:hypothetical protein
MCAKKMSGMPSSDEIAALDKVLDGEIEWGDLDDWENTASAKDWKDDVPVSAFNNPVPKKNRAATARQSGEAQQQAKRENVNSPNPTTIPRRATPLKRPNSDWRNSATRNPNPEESGDMEYVVDADEQLIDLQQQQQRDWNNPGAGGNGVDSMFQEALDSSFVDLDDLGYNDFERAFAELEMGGLNPGGGGSKQSMIVREHEGLMSGQIIKGGVWGTLIQPDGQPTRFSRVHKATADLVVLYAAPRRVNEEFRTVLSEFSRLPMNKMKIAAVAVNTDDSNDHRKMIKRVGSDPVYSLLSDPTGILMEALKCKSPGRSVSALLLLSLNKKKETGETRMASDVDATIVRVLYQGDWDASTTRDVVVEEVEEYRKDPVGYMQRQVGLS